MPRRGRLRSWAFVALCAAVAGTTAVVVTQVPAATAGAGAHHGAEPGPRGYRGPRGYSGRRGRTGPSGALTPGGLLDQSVSINWQNGRQSDGDSAEFAIPGIGEGELVCSESTQWLRVFPVDQRDEVTMWLVRQQDGTPATVRTARHTQFTGPDFNEGLNRYRGERVTAGSFAGLISSRGPWTGRGGPGPPPTSFHVSFDWNFTNLASARCYVAAQFITES